MRKSRKQVMAIILAAGMAVTGNAAAYASSAGTVTGVTTGAAGALGSATETTIKGTINVTTVKVKVPLNAAFDIDPNVYDGNVGTQITVQSEDYKIVNESSSPVWVYVSAVTPTNVTLVNKTADLSGPKTMMLAVKKTGTATTSAVSTPAFWLMSDVDDSSKRYVLDPDSATDKGKIAAMSGSTGTEMKLNLYALTQNGWTHADEFSVKPSFMIAVADPNL